MSVLGNEKWRVENLNSQTALCNMALAAACGTWTDMFAVMVCVALDGMPK